MTFSLNRKCVNCGADEWWVINNRDEYIEVCEKCCNQIVHRKQDFINKFECPECGGLSGSLEENDYKIGVRCTNCHNVQIVFNKNEITINNRNIPEQTEQDKEKFRNFVKYYTAVKCPKCGSTAITTGKRGFSLMTGFIGSNKTVNRCASCGFSWHPKR